MKFKIKKKALAREVLVFFGCIVLLGLLLSLILLRNLYYEQRISLLNKKSTIISEQLLVLPSSYDLDLYNQIKPFFKVPVQAANSNINISSEDKDILDDFNSTMLNNVSYEEFKKLIINSDYQNRVGKILGIRVDSSSVIRNLNYNSSIGSKREELAKSFDAINSSAAYYSINSASQGDIIRCLLIGLLLIVVIGYGLRFSIVLIVWAIKEVKRDDSGHSKITANE